jgi:hypothetical protein
LNALATEGRYKEYVTKGVATQILLRNSLSVCLFQEINFVNYEHYVSLSREVVHDESVALPWLKVWLNHKPNYIYLIKAGDSTLYQAVTQLMVGLVYPWGIEEHRLKVGFRVNTTYLIASRLRLITDDKHLFT